jgi:hypothetical protein
MKIRVLQVMGVGARPRGDGHGCMIGMALEHFAGWASARYEAVAHTVAAA